MSDVTKGGITHKVLTNRRAGGKGGLQAYRDKQKKDQREPYLFSATRHCSHDLRMQIAEWKSTRQRHDTDGAKRSARGKHEVCDENGLHASGEYGTHVEYFDPVSKRNRKRLARDGETPTHLYFSPEQLTVKQSEATHTIYAAGADLVNPDDPESMQRFFEAVVAEREANYAGLQESIWGERNGKSGLFHVHVASNATIYETFEVDGIEYKAGSKMAGALTDVDRVRDRFNNFLDAHPEFGFEQALARVGTPEYEAAQLRDGQKNYWDQTRGNESNHEKIRRLVHEGLPQCSPDSDGFILGMPMTGVEVKEVGLRRGLPTKSHDYSYRLKATNNWVRGKTLGADFTFEAITAKQEQIAHGEAPTWITKQSVGQPKALPELTNEDLAAVDALVAEELELRAAEKAAGSSADAPAVDEPVVPSAPAAVSTDAAKSFDELLRDAQAAAGVMHESPLRKLPKQRNPNMQTKIDELADLDERLYRGEPFADEQVPSGMTRKFLDAEAIAKRLDPDLRRRLLTRADKMAAKDAEHRHGVVLREKYEVAPTAELRLALSKSNLHRDRMDAERRADNYEPTPEPTEHEVAVAAFNDTMRERFAVVSAGSIDDHRQQLIAERLERINDTSDKQERIEALEELLNDMHEEEFGRAEFEQAQRTKAAEEASASAPAAASAAGVDQPTPLQRRLAETAAKQKASVRPTAPDTDRDQDQDRQM